MFESLEAFFEGSADSLSAFSSWCSAYMPSAIADHICYKCGDSEEFEYLRQLFESESTFIYQSIISGRRIAVIRMNQVIQTPLGEIHFLELSDQKPDGSQVSGFDHIEIFPAQGTVEDLVSDLEQKGMVFEKVVRPHHTTYDAIIDGTFKVRLEAEALVEKIKRDELK